MINIDKETWNIGYMEGINDPENHRTTLHYFDYNGDPIVKENELQWKFISDEVFIIRVSIMKIDPASEHLTIVKDKECRSSDYQVFSYYTTAVKRYQELVQSFCMDNKYGYDSNVAVQILLYSRSIEGLPEDVSPEKVINDKNEIESYLILDSILSVVKDDGFQYITRSMHLPEQKYQTFNNFIKNDGNPRLEQIGYW